MCRFMRLVVPPHIQVSPLDPVGLDPKVYPPAGHYPLDLAVGELSASGLASHRPHNAPGMTMRAITFQAG